MIHHESSRPAFRSLIGVTCAAAIAVSLIAAPQAATAVSWNAPWRDHALSSSNVYYSWQSTLKYSALRTTVLPDGYTAMAATGSGWSASATTDVILYVPYQKVLAKCKGGYVVGLQVQLTCRVGINNG